MKVVKIQAAVVAGLSILNSSSASPGATKKVAALVVAALVTALLTGKVKLIYLFIYLICLFTLLAAGPDVLLLRQHTTFSMCMIIKAMHAVIIIIT